MLSYSVRSRFLLKDWNCGSVTLRSSFRNFTAHAQKQLLLLTDFSSKSYHAYSIRRGTVRDPYDLRTCNLRLWSVILSKNNWSLLPLCFTLSLESAPLGLESTLFSYQFLHFLLTYCFTRHFFLFWFTTLYIYNCLFDKSYPRSFTSSSRTASTDLSLDRFFWTTWFLILFFFLIFCFWVVR